MPSVILEKMKTVLVDDRPWTSPDGKVTIWNIKLESPDGERNQYSTMSKAVAQVGFLGDIELYTNAKGKDYVRQAPKEELVQPQAPSTWHESPEKQAAINRAVALNGAVAYVPYVKKHEIDVVTEVLEVADRFYAWLQNEQPLIDPFAKDIGVGEIEYSEKDM